MFSDGCRLRTLPSHQLADPITKRKNRFRAQSDDLMAERQTDNGHTLFTVDAAGLSA